MSDAQLIRCQNCSALNRVPAEKLLRGSKAVCGRCKKPLTGIQPVTVTDATFSALEAAPLPVLVDVWAPWCGPCRQLAPVVEQLASELAGRVLVAKLNCDENPVTAGRFGIQGIPALLILQNGREVDRIIGVQPKTEILRHLMPVLT